MTFCQNPRLPQFDSFATNKAKFPHNIPAAAAAAAAAAEGLVCGAVKESYLESQALACITTHVDPIALRKDKHGHSGSTEHILLSQNVTIVPQTSCIRTAGCV